MADKKETAKIEREYIIPLRAKRMHVPRYKKTPKSVKTIKEFIAKHMKIYDRDLDKIKLDRYLNEYMWARGIKNPVHKVKVKAIKEGIGEDAIVRVELVNYPINLKFKKMREEKKKKEAEASKKEKKKETEKKTDAEKESIEEHKKIEEEKKSSTIESTEKMEKLESQKQKHSTDIGGKQQKHQFRQALQK